MARNAARTSPLTVVVATALAWLVPGAGHAFLGRVWQGAIIFVVIGATFWGGVAIGGVMTVDSINERWWFAAQTLTGGHGLISYYRQQRVWERLSKEMDIPVPTAELVSRDPGIGLRLDERLARHGLSPVHPADAAARAYTGVAGMLNLMCVFDVLMLALMGRPPLVSAGPPEAKGQRP